MFTGLIQGVGVVERVVPGPVTDLWVRGEFDDADARHGESIACSGICLTVVEWKGRSFRVQAAPETLVRTTVGSWVVGTRVNLEKALRVGERLGGHWVQGHVDSVARVREVVSDQGSWRVRCELPPVLKPFLVEKGSICIDGVSLTLTEVTPNAFGVMLIPETWERTTLCERPPGSLVNLEADIVGKYVAHMLGQRGSLTEEHLRLAGFGSSAR